jgi:hypothetical protein
MTSVKTKSETTVINFTMQSWTKNVNGTLEIKTTFADYNDGKPFFSTGHKLSLDAHESAGIEFPKIDNQYVTIDGSMTGKRMLECRNPKGGSFTLGIEEESWVLLKETEKAHKQKLSV